MLHISQEYTKKFSPQSYSCPDPWPKYPVSLPKNLFSAGQMRTVLNHEIGELLKNRLDTHVCSGILTHVIKLSTGGEVRTEVNCCARSSRSHPWSEKSKVQASWGSLSKRFSLLKRISWTSSHHRNWQGAWMGLESSWISPFCQYWWGWVSTQKGNIQSSAELLITWISEARSCFWTVLDNEWAN